MADTSKSDGGSRWWEFYTVRYAMGTVVGAIVFYFLCATVPALKPLLFDSAVAGVEPKISAIKLDSVQLGLLATYGLVYCYIASAPILVLHAGRFLFARPGALKDWLGYLAGIFLVAAALSFFLSAKNIVHWVVGLGCSFVLILQYLVIIKTLFNSDAMFKFSSDLALRRQEAKGGITDSYRHLREHGNSFFIVFLEAILGLALVGVASGSSSTAQTIPTHYWLILLSILWVFPAVLVWLVGTLFEQRFSEQLLPVPSTSKPPKIEITVHQNP
jgi:hypothetical protein